MGCTVIPAGRVHLLTHILLLPVDGLQLATGLLQVRVPEPQLDCTNVNASQQVHKRERLAEFVDVELLANRVIFAGHCLSVSSVESQCPQFCPVLKSRHDEQRDPPSQQAQRHEP